MEEIRVISVDQKTGKTGKVFYIITDDKERKMATFDQVKPMENVKGTVTQTEYGLQFKKERTGGFTPRPVSTRPAALDAALKYAQVKASAGALDATKLTPDGVLQIADQFQKWLAQ